MSEEDRGEYGANPQPQGREEHGQGLYIGKRSLWLLAGGALGALAALSLEKVTRKVRPTAVGVVKEGYAFKEWAAGKYEKVKEDFEDIIAEAIYEYEREHDAAVDADKREKAILERIERIVEERLAKIDAEQPTPGKEEQP
ncbi:hypothetical protein [Geoalkalibacter sp.]|uniref:hypothetical protein n=1 Tax=Geoalkalibacter sp. TaxID=3041440 RepID=UPI00272EB75F|nr:hypothetical protein [Geoalkalibacter sp.]